MQPRKLVKCLNFDRCGKTFIPTDHRQKYCTKECWKTNSRLPAIPCGTCGKIFEPTMQKKQKHCSRECYYGRPRTSPQSRFWENVNKSGPIHPKHGQCWIWTGSLCCGYGRCRGGEDGEETGAHRISWEIHYGPLGPEDCVLHHCDNPPCVNPAHLFVGGRPLNNLDMAKKERCTWAKLTIAKVKEIKYLHLIKGVSQKTLAAMYGVSGGAISHIFSGHSWKHVEDQTTGEQKSLFD